MRDRRIHIRTVVSALEVGTDREYGVSCTPVLPDETTQIPKPVRRQEEPVSSFLEELIDLRGGSHLQREGRQRARRIATQREHSGIAPQRIQSGQCACRVSGLESCFRLDQSGFDAVGDRRWRPTVRILHLHKLVGRSVETLGRVGGARTICKSIGDSRVSGTVGLEGKPSSTLTVRHPEAAYADSETPVAIVLTACTRGVLIVVLERRRHSGDGRSRVGVVTFVQQRTTLGYLREEFELIRQGRARYPKCLVGLVECAVEERGPSLGGAESEGTVGVLRAHRHRPTIVFGEQHIGERVERKHLGIPSAVVGGLGKRLEVPDREL